MLSIPEYANMNLPLLSPIANPAFSSLCIYVAYDPWRYLVASQLYENHRIDQSQECRRHHLIHYITIHKTSIVLCTYVKWYNVRKLRFIEYANFRTRVVLFY